MRMLLILCFLLIQGCFGSNTKPQVETVYVRVPVPGPVVPCRIPPITPPIDLVEGLKASDNIYVKAKTLLADREFKEAYRLKLESAITSCNQKD